MSNRALLTRIGKIRRVDKMKSFVQVGENDCAVWTGISNPACASRVGRFRYTDDYAHFLCFNYQVLRLMQMDDLAEEAMTALRKLCKSY